MKAKKVIPTLAACLLAGAMFTGGAVAYLTDTDTATNTFTFGEVKIDTVEPNYPGNGSDETVDLVANEEVPKDPQIHNSGKNRAVVFSQVDIPMANVILAEEDGTRLPQGNNELFDYRTTTGTFDSTNPEWVLIDTLYLDDDSNVINEAHPVGQDQATKVRRIYGYSTVLDENETTTSVFDVVRMANVIEGQIDNSTQNIVITSYAIQAENIAGLTDAHYDDVMDEEQLSNIFEVYVNQSGDVDPDDADTSNDQTVIKSTLNVTMQVADTHLELNSKDLNDAKTKATVKVAYTGKGTAPVHTFASSDINVATVDSDGNIVAKGVGTTVITAEAKNPDTGKIAKATVTIQVRDMNSGEASQVSVLAAEVSADAE